MWRDKGKSERTEGKESLHIAGGPVGCLGSDTNLHIKFSSVIEHTHSVEQFSFHTHNNDDDDNLVVMMIIINNNFNEAFCYQLIVYHRYAAIPIQSVFWTAVFRRFLLSPKVKLNLFIRQESSKV
jgi:hypothetical protein